MQLGLLGCSDHSTLNVFQLYFLRDPTNVPVPKHASTLNQYGVPSLWLKIQRPSTSIATRSSVGYSPMSPGVRFSDLKAHHVAICSVYELVCNSICRETGAHARPQLNFAGISHQRRFSFQNVDELILLAMPVKKGRFSALKQPSEIDSKVPQSEMIAQCSFLALLHPGSERLGIA